MIRRFRRLEPDFRPLKIGLESAQSADSNLRLLTSVPARVSREQFIQLQNLSDMLKGLIGVGSTMLGIITSNLDQIESWLRIASLLVGIAVGIATVWSLTRRRK